MPCLYVIYFLSSLFKTPKAWHENSYNELFLARIGNHRCELPGRFLEDQPYDDVEGSTLPLKIAVTTALWTKNYG